MGAVLQDLWSRYVWNGSKRSYPDDLTTINGTLLQSILTGDALVDEKINIREALRISTVWTCIHVRGLTMASLPGNVIQENGGRKENLTDHSVYYSLAHEPNEYMTSAVFFITLLLHYDAWGNAFARINRDSRNNPVSYDIWEPWEVTISKEKGNLYYTYKGETVSSWDVLHFRSYSFDGICGRSAILENSTTMAMAKKLDRYAGLILGAQPPGVLSYEGQLTPEQRAENRKLWQQRNKGDVAVLSGKWQYNPIMTPGDEVQYTQTKDKIQQEICGIWQIPLTFVQNFQRATYSNAEQSDLVYAKHTITPICRIFEQEINMKLFFEREKKNTYWKFNMNGLLRGDLAARTAFYQAMVNGGIYLRNEARSLEDLNEYDGGDVPLIQGAMIPGDQEGIEALRKKMETEVIPTAQPPKPKMNGHTVLN